MIEEIRPLKIGLIGYNHIQTREGIKYIYENNKDDIKQYNKGYHTIRLLFKDGTVIEPIFSHESSRGYKFDQLILFDDERWEVKIEQIELINYVYSYLMNYTFVPKEYRIIEYLNV